MKQLKSKYGENPNVSTVYEENELPKVSSPNKHFPGIINHSNIYNYVAKIPFTL